MKRQTLSLMAGALAVTGAFALHGAASAEGEAYTDITTVEALANCLEAAAADGVVCKLGGDIGYSDDITIIVPSGITKALDLNGYSIDCDDPSGALHHFGITSMGVLNINSATGGDFYGDIMAQAGGKVIIRGGAYWGFVTSTNVSETFGQSDITIHDGTFYFDVNHSANAMLNIEGGVFNGTVYGMGEKGLMNIHGGTFNEAVQASRKSKITGGVFHGAVECAGDNVNLEITGGTFDQVECGDYYAGSKLDISGGVFNSGFEIGVETANISGGTFKNGWYNIMQLTLSRPLVQKFSITGGTFTDVTDEGRLIMISSTERLNDDIILEIFKGGDMLSGMAVEYSEDGLAAYIAKAKTVDGNNDETGNTDGTKDEKPETQDDEDKGISVPDTGRATKTEDGVNVASVHTIIILVLVTTSVLTILSYSVFRKKISFGKK